MERNSNSSPQHQVLNPLLYARLEYHLGPVEVVNRGAHDLVDYLPDMARPGKVLRSVRSFGEQYRVNCPYCHDTRKRCYIGNTYGTRDSRTGYPIWTAWICFNEQCQSDPKNRERLRCQLEITPQKPLRGQPRQGSPAPQVAEPASLCVPLPAGLRPLADLTAGHPALAYLRGRDFDPLEVGSLWDVRYLPPDTTVYGNRLVIPIDRPTIASSVASPAFELAGWQARAIDELTEAERKYLFPAGMRKSKLLYGLRQARASDGPVVICEGVADVWRIGPGAVALLGKSISQEQHRQLLRYFLGRPMVVLLDRDAIAEAIDLARALRTSRVHFAGDNRVVIGHLPPGRKDPGECTPAELEEVLAVALNGIPCPS